MSLNFSVSIKVATPLPGELRARTASDAKGQHLPDLSASSPECSGGEKIHTPLFAQRPGSRSAQSGLGHGYHLYPDAIGLYVPYSDH